MFICIRNKNGNLADFFFFFAVKVRISLRRAQDCEGYSKIKSANKWPNRLQVAFTSNNEHSEAGGFCVPLEFFFWDSKWQSRLRSHHWGIVGNHKNWHIIHCFHPACGFPGASCSAAASDWCLWWYIAKISLVTSVWLRNLFHSNHI